MKEFNSEEKKTAESAEAAAPVSDTATDAANAEKSGNESSEIAATAATTSDGTAIVSAADAVPAGTPAEENKAKSPKNFFVKVWEWLKAVVPGLVLCAK